MAYVTDLTHFDGVLDEGSTAPAPAKRLARFLSEVVRITSREGAGVILNTDVRCFKRPSRRVCEGRIQAVLPRGGDTVEWQCPECRENGYIRNWRGTDADLSRFTRPRAPAPPIRAPMPALESQLDGRWRISKMALWTKAEMDSLGPAFIEFGKQGQGSFQFVAVRGALDCFYGERDGAPSVEFSWEGHDDGHPMNGRGWAILAPDGSLKGRFYFHRGDDSSFAAARAAD